MDIQEQLTNLAQSKRLVELGIDYRQPNFYHLRCMIETLTPDPRVLVYRKEEVNTYNEIIAPAFTVSELACMLLVLYNQGRDFELSRLLEDKYKLNEPDDNDTGIVKTSYSPEFIADVIIHALEIKFVTAEQLNAVLNK